MAETILVVEDDMAFQGLLVDALSTSGFEVLTAGSAEEGLEIAKKGGIDLILHDIKLPGISGLQALPMLRESAPGVDIIVMTGHDTRDSGVQAMKSGAYDYFTKPFSLGEMEVVIRRAFEKRRMQQELERLRRHVPAGSPLENIIGNSEAISEVKSRIERIAPLESDVLILGETGTGKELISDTIHAMSKRAGGPFIKVNCAAIPENLIESELFGHEKGAFTGATAIRKGKFEQARGGTLLLDEIGDMPLHLQPKLLRAVEQKQVERLGGTRPVAFDVRIIAATNLDLETQVKDGRFRSDLFYRLNVGTINLPSLCERRSDIPLLAEFFLHKANRKLGTSHTGYEPAVMRAMYNFDWPGNVRQLANAVERAAIFAKGPLISHQDLDLAFTRVTDMPQQTGSTEIPPEGISLKEAMQVHEKTLILSALRRTAGKQTEAATLLGISPKNLWNKLQKHDLGPTNLG